VEPEERSLLGNGSVNKLPQKCNDELNRPHTNSSIVKNDVFYSVRAKWLSKRRGESTECLTLK
jgi:hypothetical protein